MSELGKIHPDLELVARRSRLGYAQSRGANLQDVPYANQILEYGLNGEVLSELAEWKLSAEFLLPVVVML